MMKISVRMLGAFSIFCDGKRVVLGRNSTAKFTQLLQIVWLNMDRGVSKQQIVEALYGDDELSNPNNSFNNLLFQMRKQMVAAGLPRRDYITKIGRLYFPDPGIELQVDVHEFCESIQKARETDQESRKEEAYSQAFSLYQGELLPEEETLPFVITESVRLAGAFSEAVRYLGERAKEQKDFDKMNLIYEKAAQIYPDNDWQADQIEALIGKGSYTEALSLYDKTVSRYADEMGIPPSEKLLESYRKMSQKITSPTGHIYDIQTSLQEDPVSGAYYCSYPSFIDTYHVLERNMERMGNSVFLLLCTLVDYAGKPIRNKDKLDEHSETFRGCIGRSLRRGDIFTKYSASQYLVLLVGSSKEGCDVVARRIDKELREKVATRAEARYSNVSLADLTQITDWK